MSTFQFKYFRVSQTNTTMKVGTDSMLLGALVKADDPHAVLDIGTGTGVIALMLAQRFVNAEIIGLEIDQKACEEADFNFQESSWNNRLSSVNEDVLQVNFDQSFDLIVSNPPYYENSLLSENERTSRAKHAAFLPVSALLKKVSTLLTENGKFWVIVPSENSESWIESASENQLFLNQSVSIFGKEGQGRKRAVLVFSREQRVSEKSSLTVRNEKGAYTKEYIELTKEFHDRDLSK